METDLSSANAVLTWLDGKQIDTSAGDSESRSAERSAGFSANALLTTYLIPHACLMVCACDSRRTKVNEQGRHNRQDNEGSVQFEAR